MNIPAERLKELLVCDAQTGILIWLPRESANFNVQHAGKRAGNVFCWGYEIITIFGKIYRVHRIVWQMCVGEIPPDKMIDHINGNRADNRLENLRLATKLQNNHNRARKRNSKSGFKGVYWNKRARKWRASIGHGGKSLHLGTFDTPEAAHMAYCESAVKFFGEFARMA